jgi:hypothetical protein
MVFAASDLEATSSPSAKIIALADAGVHVDVTLNEGVRRPG